MSHPFLALEGVTQVLADGRILFSDLDECFDLRQTALVGRNGVGKSMLARVLAGRLAPTAAAVLKTVGEGRWITPGQQLLVGGLAP